MEGGRSTADLQMMVIKQRMHALEEENPDTLKSMGKGRGTGGGGDGKKQACVMREAP